MLRFRGWFGRLLYRLEWRLNQRLLGRPGHWPCAMCRWIFPLSVLTDNGLCPGCAAWRAEECRAQETYDEAWVEYERYLKEEARRIRKETEQAWREHQKEKEKAFRQSQRWF